MEAGMQAPEGVPVLASWGRRFAAYLIDQVVLLLLTIPGLAAVGAGAASDPNNGVLVGVGVVLIAVAILIVPPVYYTMLHGKSGQTLAKRWLGLRVIDATIGGPIGYGRAFGRWLAVFVMGFFCSVLNILDGLWPLWDEQRQTWHDKLASSVVVKV